MSSEYTGEANLTSSTVASITASAQDAYGSAPAGPQIEQVRNDLDNARRRESDLAARLGRNIMYIPIGQLSPVSMKKIRVVHVLDGYDKRKIAKDYIR